MSRLDAINKLGGIVCKGLSFIKGPNCPVPPEQLTAQDINFAHRVSVGKLNRKRHVWKSIMASKRPDREFVLLCTLCNQRMRYLKQEFAFTTLPKRVIYMYAKKKWTLEQIAQEYGCSYPTVSGFLKRCGITVRVGANCGGQAAWSRPQSRRALLKERRTRFLSPTRIDLAIQVHKMYDDGDSSREIAEWLGITKGAVLSLLKLSA